MCAGCADWLGACEPCGPRPRVNPDGTVNRRYLKHFYLDDIPCGHVVEGHAAECRIRAGRGCDCDVNDE